MASPGAIRLVNLINVSLCSQKHCFDQILSILRVSAKSLTFREVPWTQMQIQVLNSVRLTSLRVPVKAVSYSEVMGKSGGNYKGDKTARVENLHKNGFSRPAERESTITNKRKNNEAIASLGYLYIRIAETSYIRQQSQQKHPVDKINRHTGVQCSFINVFCVGEPRHTDRVSGPIIATLTSKKERTHILRSVEKLKSLQERLYVLDDVCQNTSRKRQTQIDEFIQLKTHYQTVHFKSKKLEQLRSGQSHQQNCPTCSHVRIFQVLNFVTNRIQNTSSKNNRTLT